MFPKVLSDRLLSGHTYLGTKHGVTGIEGGKNAQCDYFFFNELFICVGKTARAYVCSL